MAMFETTKGKSILAMVFALLVGYMGYSGEGLKLVGVDGLKTRQERARAAEDSLAALVAQTDSVKRLLTTGSSEELAKQTEAYRGILETLRQLVPEAGEVPGLIDAISTRAKIRGVHLAIFTPEPVENGPSPFDTYRYRVHVIGHYDQIGEWLTDVASLRRIIVPVNLTLRAANAASARALGDTSKAMLEAALQVKTYVKAPGDGGSGAGGAGGSHD